MFNYTLNDVLDHYLIYEISCIFFSLFSLDFMLIFLFGKKARWFQLHAMVNLYITYEILPTVVNIMKDPSQGYKICDNDFITLLIISLHIYHVISFRNLKPIDYFHHILFVGLGVLPDLFFIKYNQKYLAYIVASGIPGFFEYTILTLCKNNLISINRQKQVNAFLYNFIRMPFCCVAITMNYNAYLNDYLKDNFFITLYVNTLLYLNGTIFNYLTIVSYVKLRESEKIM